MMKKSTAKKLFGGICAVMATLFSLSLCITPLANYWEAQVNEALGIKVTSTTTGGDSSIDTTYYKSSFGDISALYTSDPTAAQTKALADAQAALIAAEKEFAIREQEEGSVLLKNDEEALPLTSSERSLTLFGRAVAPGDNAGTVFRSSSAGASVTTSQRTTFAQALTNAGFTYNEKLYNAIANDTTATRVRTNANGAADIGELDVSFYTPYKDDIDTDTVAVIMFSRMAGEGFDLSVSDADGISQLALHNDEADLLKLVKSMGFKKTVVLINSAYPMEMDWLYEDQYGVDACLWIGEPSMYGFDGVANLLSGAANPSGRLVDTYAANSLSAPSVINFGDTSYTNNSDYKYVVEAEGIYIGYKYYETRYEDCILNQGNASSTKGSSSSSAWSYADEIVFPFGYGLSYTTFEQKLKSVEYDAETDSYNVTVSVTNTGDVAGKCVVQVYAQTPYDSNEGIEKSSVILAGYNKTYGTYDSGEAETESLEDRDAGQLQPGETEDVVVEVDRYLLASYSTSARSGKGGYVLSEGDYYFAIGDNAHDALNNILAAKGATGLVDENGNSVTGDGSENKVTKLTDLGASKDETTYSTSRYTGEEISNALEDADINYWQSNSVTYLSRSDWEGTWPTKIELSLTEDMQAEMDGGSYEASSSATKKGTYTQGVDSGIDFIDMKDVPFTGTYTDSDGNEQDADEMWNKFLDQLTVEELVQTTTENTSKTVSSINSPVVSCNDGPDGVGGTMPDTTNGSYTTTAYPSEVVSASAFNPKVSRLRGYFIGEDGLFSGVQFQIGPGANIHRTPFSGRNFEYYSEDATVSYYAAYYQTVEMQKKGVSPMIKHFVGNNQETNRTKLATFNNEQAWRESSFRAFEGALAKGEGLGVMGSYSLVGCTAPTASTGAGTTILLGEWGFKGIYISDASGDQPYMDTARSVINGLNMWCMDNRESEIKKLEGRSSYDDYLEALRDGNKRYYYAVLRTHAVNGIAPGATITVSSVWWKSALVALEIGLGILTGVAAVAYVFFGYFSKGKKEV